MNKTQLVDRLLEEGVPLSRWGNDVDRKIGRLAKETEIYGARINRDSLGRLTLAFPVIEIDFLHNDKILVRTREILAEAKTEIKTRPLCDIRACSIAVPTQKGRPPLTTALEAVQSFFCLPDGHIFDNFTSYPMELVGPMFTENEYPGLRVMHALYTFDWHVPLKHFQPIGYCNEEAEGTVSYLWFGLTDVRTLDMKAVMQAISEAQL